MRMELPVLTRCCFCFPLRYGLITWGYVRLASSMFFFTGMFISFYNIWEMAANEENPKINIIYTVIIGFLLLLTITDLVLNTIFVVGGHRKDLKLLRAYYIYSFILCILCSLMGVASATFTLLLFKIGEIDLSLHIWIILVDTATLLAQVLAQVYVVILLRSEIMKLRNQSEFRFVNNAVEAECTLKCEEISGEEESDYTYERYVPELYNK